MHETQAFIIWENTLQPIKRSLSTHCPIMLRVHGEGHFYDETVCRCDVSTIKPLIHPNRCSSVRPCEVRTHLIAQGEKVEQHYKLL
jgi:hypothetical protein